MANFSLPKQFPNQPVTVHFQDHTNLVAEIQDFNEFWLLIETKQGSYLIPWTAVSDLWVAKEKED